MKVCFVYDQFICVHVVYENHWQRDVTSSNETHIGLIRRNVILLGQTLTFEGTCQVGQVTFNFYLPNTILTCPAKGVIEWT